MVFEHRGALPPVIIDVDFEVVDDGYRPIVPWSFMDDDFPELVGMARGFAMAFFLTWLFHRF